MARTLDALASAIEAATAPGFRGDLIARGRARSLRPRIRIDAGLAAPRSPDGGRTSPSADRVPEDLVSCAANAHAGYATPSGTDAARSAPMTELAAWAVAGVLILFNAALAGSEMALVSLPAHRREALRERGSHGERAARLAANPDRYLSTVQIGITLVGFL